MTDEEPTLHQNGATATLEPPPPAETAKKTRKKGDDDLEYEVEFATPFGKLEFEFEPVAKKEQKDRERKQKAEREAAKRALKAAERAAASGERRGRGVLGTLAIVLVVLAVIAAIIAIAFWLFGRPERDDAKSEPSGFVEEPQPAQGLVGRARGRVRDAISAGRRASSDAQREQREKFEHMRSGG
jgi:hypothetical protein